MDAAAAAHEFGSGLRAHLGFEHEGIPAPQVAPPAPPEQHEPAAADPREEELAERLAYLAIAEEALTERERRVAEREDDVHAREEKLEREVAHAAVDLRQLLRWRAEQHGETVWRAFDEALHASTPDGHPDHPIRIAAARALLAEAYTGVGAAALEDELAQLRARRSAYGS